MLTGHFSSKKAVAQTDMEVAQQQQQQQQQLLGSRQQLMTLQRGSSSSYIPGDRFPETLTRHLMTDASGAAGGMMMGMPGGPHPYHQVQMADGSVSFYPDMLLDIPNRGSRGGGSPSTHSGNSAETATAAVVALQNSGVMTMPLSAAHLAAHHHQHHPGTGYVQPPIQFTDTSSTTSSTALLIPAGASRPGYVTLPRRPRPRMPSWASSPPPMSSPGPSSILSDDQAQPLYDTIGPRVTADGSSASALSLNKIAGLAPVGSGGLGSPRASTLARGHKISLPAYYVPIEEVEVPPASPLVQQRQSHQSSTPNMLNYYHHNNNNNSSSGSGTDGQAVSSSSEVADAPLLSPIPDLRQPGNRTSVSSLNSINGTSSLQKKKKTPPAVAPKPVGPGGLVRARPASVTSSGTEGGPLGPMSPTKVAPKPPPKPKKRPSTTSNNNSNNGEDGLVPFEDEGEDGTEV